MLKSLYFFDVFLRQTILVPILDEAFAKRPKRVAIELGTTPQALIAEGINMVLAKYAKPTVAT
jgi:hypothetical protein